MGETENNFLLKYFKFNVFVHFHPSLIFPDKAVAYLFLALMGLHLSIKHLNLPTNIRLD